MLRLPFPNLSEAQKCRPEIRKEKKKQQKTCEHRSSANVCWTYETEDAEKPEQKVKKWKTARTQRHENYTEHVANANETKRRFFSLVSFAFWKQKAQSNHCEGHGGRGD